jgi:hypothetical protein
VVNKVSPNTTLTKAAYQAVRISGAQGQRLAVALAQANNDNNSADTIGLVTETIATNQEGFIMTVGSLESINTTGSLQGETWADGDVIYLSPITAGALTNIKPIAPQHIIVIGYVEYAHANNGKLYVKVMNGWELGELHDVDTTGATNGQVLKYNGTIWTPSADSGITGTGTSGQVAYFTGATTQAGDAGLTYDSTNKRLQFGTTGTRGYITYDGSDNTIFNIDSASGRSFRVGSTDRNIQVSFASNIFRAAANIFQVSNGAEAARFFSSTNFGIGTGASDTGQKLQVIGTSYFSDSVGIGSTSLTASSLRISKNIAGGGTSYGILQDGVVQSSVSAAEYFYTSAATQATTFTLGALRHYLATQGTFGAGSTVNNQYGFFVAPSLTGAVNNYAFYGDIAAATGRWNIYMNGTASNFLRGQTSIGDTSVPDPAGAWQRALVIGNTGANKIIAGYLGSATNGATIGANNSALSAWADLNIAGSNLIFRANGETEGMRLNSSRNLLIGSTSDTGEKLQVTGDVVFKSNTNTILTINSNGGSALLRLTTTVGTQAIRGGLGGTNNMVFETNSTERMRLDASGNLGIGATPSAWSTVNTTALQVRTASLWSVNSRTYVGANYYYNTAGNRIYINSSFATEYAQINGQHQWFIAASGTAEATVSLTQSMTLYSTGNLAVGSAAGDSGERLQVTGTAKITDSATFSKAYSNTSDLGVIVSASIPGINLRTVSTGRTSFIQSYNSNGTSSILVGTGSNNPTTTVMTFNGNDGTVNVGSWVASTGELLQVQGTAKITGATTFSSTVTSTQFRLSALNTAPATASSTGTLGEIRIDADYIYICTATNTWKRVAIATW